MTLGLERGDRIGIWAPNTAEWTLTQFATAKAGLVLVNVNPAYRRAELEYAMNKVECKALVLAPALKTSNYLEITGDLVKAGKLPHLKHIVRLGTEKTPGMLNFDDVAAAGGNAERVKLAELGPKLQFDDAINIQFTSGTTGFPKGATLTHHNILNNGFFVAEGLKFTENDRLCIPVPLYHCFGMVMGNLGCLTHGATRARSRPRSRHGREQGRVLGARRRGWRRADPALFWLFETEADARAAETVFNSLRAMPQAPAVLISADVCEVIAQM